MKTPIWVVKEVKATDEYVLFLTFADGSQRVFDALPLLEKPIYYALKNVALFLNAKVECGTVVWNDDTDIAPVYLYEYSKPIETN